MRGVPGIRELPYRYRGGCPPVDPGGGGHSLEAGQGERDGEYGGSDERRQRVDGDVLYGGGKSVAEDEILSVGEGEGEDPADVRGLGADQEPHVGHIVRDRDGDRRDGLDPRREPE